MDSRQLVDKSPISRLDHWRLVTDNNNVLWLYADRAGSATNTLSEAVLEELDNVIDHAYQLPANGLVVLSDKPSGFIAGADINEFSNFTSAKAATEKILAGHQVFNKLEALPCPTIAAIDGFCLGGGLELALCCDYRIAKNTSGTRIGVPEIKLGIYPGLGGSARLPEKIGGAKALELMLTGRMLKAPVAKSLGIVDELISTHEELYWAAKRAVQQKRKAKRGSASTWLSNALPTRLILALIMTRKTARQANPKHYPAPFKLINAWRKHGGSRKRMLEAEAKNVGELLVGETSINLRRVFYLMEHLKGLGKAADFQARRVHVVGAGVMGGDIAAACALQGMEVTLQDRELHYIEPALKRAAKLFSKVLKKPHAVQAAKARLVADVTGSGVARADVVIEAIFEDLEAKKSLFQSLEPQLKPGALLATNTSALPLEHLCIVLEKPERLIGLHFFNPVAKMPLVEVVKSICSDPEEVSKGCAFAAQIGKFPLPVKSSPGFLVNRVLAPYMMKAMTLYLEGTPKEAIDAAAVDFGMPMGPVELADTVGLDVCMKVAETLEEESFRRELEVLDVLVSAGKLGKKTGEGLYSWKNDKPLRDKTVKYDNSNKEHLAQRLMNAFLSECHDCLRDDIVEDADLIDAGIIFGTGFAPFRGGPVHYLNTLEARQQ